MRAGGVCEQCYWLAAHGIAVDSFLITSLSKALPRHLDHVWREELDTFVWQPQKEARQESETPLLIY